MRAGVIALAVLGLLCFLIPLRALLLNEIWYPFDLIGCVLGFLCIAFAIVLAQRRSS